MTVGAGRLKETEPLEWDKFLEIRSKLQEDQDWRGLLLWTIGGHTAYRVSDYADMTWGYLLGAESLTILQKKTAWLSKSARTVILGTNTRAIIEECARNMNPHRIMEHKVFKPCRGGRRTPGSRANLTTHGVNYILKSIAKRYGLNHKMSSHVLRKTFALRVYEELDRDHMALLTVQKMLGHTSELTTLTYLGITQSKIRRIYEKSF